MTDLVARLNGWVEAALGVLAFAGVIVALVAGAYHGARKQAAASLKPLVGDPPLEVQEPIVKKLDDLFRRLDRQEERTLQTAREIAEVRDDVGRNTRDIDAVREQTRGHEERLGRLERRVGNVERACHLNHRADSDPPGASV